MDHVFSISQTNQFDTSTNSDVEVQTPLLVAPANTRLGSGQGVGGIPPAGTVVDVVNDFYWTYSKLRESRQEVPKIILSEKRLKTNALISQLKYSYGVTKEGFNAAVDTLLSEEQKNSLMNFLKETSNKISSTEIGGKTIGDQLQERFESLQDSNNVFETNPYLKPYQELYITEPTGWEFYFPYFDNYSGSQLNSFSDEAPNPFLGIIKQGAEVLTDAASIASALRGPASISFVERSKFYSYSSEGEEFSFNFPLINTGSVSFEDVIRNWELLFLILYNNKPGRRNRSIIDPPVIYQVEIPGVKFLPFCYISNIAVEFQGSRRELSIDLPFIENYNVDAAAPIPGQTQLQRILNKLTNSEPKVRGFINSVIPRKINAIIPDAYNIKITVKSLVAESKNFMYSILKGQELVTTSTREEQAVGIVRTILGR